MVSIILPTYNGEKYISKSIESCLEQTYKNIELIIVDDCSTDRTPAIISEYAEQDKRIKIITNKKNRMLPASLNIGFEAARGEYLTWTSDDNYYENNAIELMLEELAQNKDCGLTYADLKVIDEDDNFIYYNRNAVSNGNPNDIPIYNPVGACFLYTREVYNKVGDYDVNKELIEDWDYWFRIYLDFKITHIPKALYYYREHKNSLSSKRQEDQYYKTALFIVDSCDKNASKIPSEIRLRAYLRASSFSMKIDNKQFAKACYEKAHLISNDAHYYTTEVLNNYIMNLD